MRSNKLLNAIVETAALAGVLLASSVSYAADVYLQTESYTKDLYTNDPVPVLIESVPMWGFVSCDGPFAASGTTCEPVASPGPQISLTDADSLTIHVNNTLPTPVSIVIPGQMEDGAGMPIMDVGRVRSFTHETAALSESMYTWTTLRPGTYLYQSGTYPSIQVPMGLYGALVVGPATTTCTDTTRMPAYNADNCYDDEVVMLFSEIDPVQNQAVVDASGVVADYPSTINYSPSFLLVNGELSADLTGIGDTGDDEVSSAVLLRMLNAGSRSHTPAIVGLDMALIAEDGNLYPGNPLIQAQALLPAGKTLDAIVNVDAKDETFGLYDRTPDFTNADLPQGGMIANIVANDGTPTPDPLTVYAADDDYTVTEDTPYSGASVRLNDPGLLGATVTEVSPPANAQAFNLNTDGTFTYTPNPDFSGPDAFTYSANLGGNDYSANVTLNVSFDNDAPVAVADGPYVNVVGDDIIVGAVHGLLGNDIDVDGDVLTAILDDTSGSCVDDLTLLPDGSFTYSGMTDLTCNYHAEDSDGASSASLSFDLTYLVPSDITLTVEEPGGLDVLEYRWTVEEDTMWQPVPNVSDPESLGTNFHRSYMPVVAQGCVGSTACSGDETPMSFNDLVLDPTKHYFVSVLPADAMAEDDDGNRTGHTVGGARIPLGASAVTVIVNKEPLPYAQISAYIFEDNGPTNGSPDGGEQGLGGFQITLEDAGGRYGIASGAMSQDADGNGLKNSLDCFGGAEPPVGVILSCPDTPANQAAGLVGEVLITHLFPGKYGIIVTPPEESGTAANKWIQTSTIEGSKVIDAWVKAGEPAFFSEFGPAGWHAFVGFVNPESVAANNPGGGNTVTGNVTNLHMARPPDQRLVESGSNAALAHTRAWVGLNSEAGVGTNIAAVQADSDGNFQIDNVPDGEFQLVVWDSYLDQVIAYKAVSLPGGGDLGEVSVFQWFTRLENNVFLDDGAGTNAGNGIWDGDEVGLPEQAVNLRWRDGSVYQSFPTDLDGFVPFDQVFPFFHWLVAEVDYTRFEATGVTVTVDGGGDVVTSGPYAGLLSVQDGSPRTETGPVLTQGFQGFLGQTSVIDWGKRPHEPGSNGGISGIVYSGITRAESDPRLTAAEPWETGIPRVKLRLYREVATSTDGETADGTGLVFVVETETDSWDDSLPTGCPGGHIDDPVTPITKCYDGLRNFNQIRPAVFDGGYAFNDIPAGTYVVEVVPPVGWELLKEEDVNVGFGDGYAPPPVVAAMGMPAVPDSATIEAAMAEPGLAQPECVGIMRDVPSTLSLFPAAAEDAPFAGASRPLCDRKRVILSDQGQAAADFTLFTSAPVAGHFTGMILDDIAQEFNPLSIQFGEKWAPPFVPVSVRDYKGNEISRFYSDQWGRMNGLVPSTFTANMPSPSGFSPAMHMTCMNDPGPILVGGELIVDPQYNPLYSNFCYTFQYMPGATTYLDTPVLPIASFAAGYNPADCALDEGTPMIRQVDGDGLGTGPLVGPGGTLTITSLGIAVEVSNPAYEGPGATGLAAMKTIPRDFGFGAAGSVTLNGTPLTITSWDADTISATLPGGVTTGQLVVTRANGNSTEHAVTVTVSTETAVSVTGGSMPGEHKIQMAIDNASPGDLILVGPGVYHESVIMWQPVRLQGAGAGSTFINAIKAPTESLQEWRDKMQSLFSAGDVDALPNQLVGAAGFDNSEGAGITVLGNNPNGNGQDVFRHSPSRIDGFSITGADVGGGIMVNGWAHNLEIANNHVFGNSGSFHGGIRVGQPFLELDPPNGNQTYGFNEDLNIHHNSITQNGGLGGAGGGLSIVTGTDDYTVSNNYVCGNFTTGDGGGIGHFGMSDGGIISNNRIVLNQSFNQGVGVSGGGLFISGEPAVGALTLGSGDLTVDANLIQANQAGAGHGGGIRTQFINGLEVTNSNPDSWNTLTITNNMVVNNVAGYTGAGIALQDTLRSIIVNNTIAHNDSTATVGALVNTNTSVPQPAGLSSMPHSALLEDSIPNSRAEYRGFSNPVELVNNIVWQNRAFHYDAGMGVAELQPILAQSGVGECISPPDGTYWDMGVLGGGHVLSPTFSVLSSTQGTAIDPTNTMDDPALLGAYCNGGRILATAPGSMLALPALDEGGNAWIDVRYGPLDVLGDYHIGDASSALGNGSGDEAPALDFDGETRPQPGDAPFVDRGADEVDDDGGYIPPTEPGTVAYSSGAFGEVLISDLPAELTITATVSGDDVDFPVMAVTGPLAPFTMTGESCSGSTVLVGQTCELAVTYDPTAEGADTGSFTVASNAADNLQTVYLSGTGITNIITLSPGEFGEVPETTTKTLTINATVEGPLPTFSGAVIEGADFAIVSQDCSATTCSVEVSYSPAEIGESSGSLTISSDGTGSPHTVLLSGSGVAKATIAYSPGDFGDVPTGTTATLTIDALVTGTTVTFDKTATTGPTAPFAILSETCSGSTVSDGATCSFTVDYTPTLGGIDNGSFTVANNATGSPQTVDLTGFGVLPGEVAFTSADFGTLAGGSLNFGDVGNESSTVTLTVSVSPVTFGAVTVVNTSNPGSFDEGGGGTCEGATIAEGGTCTVVIDFNGSGGGNNPPIRTGTLTVLHDGVSSPPTELSLVGQ